LRFGAPGLFVVWDHEHRAAGIGACRFISNPGGQPYAQFGALGLFDLKTSVA
jgi:hypothetical protein